MNLSFLVLGRYYTHMTEPQFAPPAQVTPQQPVTPTHQQSSGLAIASMILGIVSIVSFMGFFLGVPAIILGIIALRKKAGEKSMSIVGIVTGAFSTLMSILIIGIFIWAAYSSSHSLDSTNDNPSSDWQTEPEDNMPLPPNEI